MKRKIYILCSIFLGILLSFMAYALIEKAYIDSMLSRGAVPVVIWGHNGYLSPVLAVLFLSAGVAMGYILGIRWWQIVYVEHRHWRHKLKS